jgi:hypothetical protein
MRMPAASAAALVAAAQVAATAVPVGRTAGRHGDRRLCAIAREVDVDRRSLAPALVAPAVARTALARTVGAPAPARRGAVLAAAPVAYTEWRQAG